MTIYALFLCYNLAVSRCELQGAPSWSPIFHMVIPGAVFESEADCVKASGKRPAPDGRMYVNGRTDMWLECRSKYVETWQ